MISIPTASFVALPGWVRRLARLLLASLVCLSAALYNGYPLVTSDSGTYIYSAQHLSVPDDRPITYGLFIHYTSLHFSLWLVVWAQSLLLAALLLRCMRTLVPRLGGTGQLVLLGGIAWATGLAWYSSQLMPDIFSATGLLALGLLVLGRATSRREQAALVAALLLSAIMHNSNLVAYLLTCLAVGALAWQQRLWQRGLLRRAPWLLATGTVLAAWLVLPALHAAYGGGFRLSRATPAFLVARLVEAGIMDRYLDEHCGQPDAPWLCDQRDKLPNDAIGFLWDEHSPYQQSGGLRTNETAYRRILADIATTPRYYPALASLAVQSTLRQLTHVGHGDGLWAYRENSSPYWALPTLVPFELKPYLTSQQNHNSLHFDDLNQRTYATQLLGLLTLVLALGSARRGRLPAAAVPALLLLAVWSFGLIFNAFATGALANVFDRLQGRVAWLLPLGATLLLAQLWPVALVGLRSWLRGAKADPAATKLSASAEIRQSGNGG